MNDFQIMMFVVIWFAFAVIVGAVAEQRGKEGFLFGLAALVISPLLALIIVLAVPISKPSSPEQTKCPHCHGMIDQDVSCCMHCRRDIVRPDPKEIVMIPPPFPVTIAPVKPKPLRVPLPARVKCSECRHIFSVESNRGIIETLCPQCQSILSLDTTVV